MSGIIEKEAPTDYDEYVACCRLHWIQTNANSPRFSIRGEEGDLVPTTQFICELIGLSAQMRAVERRLRWAELCRDPAAKITTVGGTWRSATVIRGNVVGIGDVVSDEEEKALVVLRGVLNDKTLSLLSGTGIPLEKMMPLLMKKLSLSNPFGI